MLKVVLGSRPDPTGPKTAIFEFSQIWDFLSLFRFPAVIELLSLQQFPRLIAQFSG